MKGSPSLLWRGIVAIGLMAGFYVFSLAIALFLLSIPYAEWHYGGRLTIKLALFCVVTALVILRSILPRVDRFQPAGPKLEANEHPKLFEQLEGVAHAAKQSLPREVYLLPEVNAWVAQRGGLMGVRSRRVMGVGLPLMSVLTVSQLRAVLAHEFGHFSGGDTKLGPWIYKTRESIGRTIQSLALRRSLVTQPFIWYGKVFLRITQAISRRQEIAADRFAAELVGSDPLIEGLRTIHRAAQAFRPFIESEFSTVLGSGFRPPLVQGFLTYMDSPTVHGALTRAMNEELVTPRADPFDSHPPLKERIEALTQLGGTGSSDDSVSAINLLADAQRAEARLVEFVVGPGASGKLLSVSWNEVPSKVLIPKWRQAVASQAVFLEAITLARLPEVAKRLGGAVSSAVTRIEAEAQRAQSQDDNKPMELGLAGRSGYDDFQENLGRANALAAAILLCLCEQGWTLHAEPGEAFIEKGGWRIEPFAAVNDMMKGDFNASQWEQQCIEYGIIDLNLGVAAKRLGEGARSSQSHPSG
jgi:heat shock protein HtpX